MVLSNFYNLYFKGWQQECIYSVNIVYSKQKLITHSNHNNLGYHINASTPLQNVLQISSEGEYGKRSNTKWAQHIRQLICGALRVWHYFW